MDKYKIIIFLLSVFQLINCQDMKKEKITPSYNVQLSHSDNKHSVGPVEDSIITLEGISAHLPYGHSSGSWGMSGKGFTDQGGTPIGADVIYYADAENAFYHLKASFPKEKVEDWVQRAYAIDESKSSVPMKQFINRRDEPDFHQKYNEYQIAYKRFSDLIFGFAPKGMVVVWFGYGPTQIELGEYQAERITNEADIKKYKEKYQRIYHVDPELFEELAKEYYLPDESPEKWKQYRARYNWYPKVTSANKGFKLFRIDTDYYNGERETMLRPWVENPAATERSVPKEIDFYWETGKGEAFEGRAFFNWETANEAFKKSGAQQQLEFKIAPDNNSFELLLNNTPFKADSLRVYKSVLKFKDSYK